MAYIMAYYEARLYTVDVHTGWIAVQRQGRFGYDRQK